MSYFHDLAIFKSYPGKRCILFYSYKRSKQLNLSITTAITLIKFSSQSYYVMIATNKWYSYPESHDDSNWCTPCRENPDQQATCILWSVCVWSYTVHISRGQRMATFHKSPIDSNGSHCPRNRAPDLIHSSPAEWSVGPYPISLPSQKMKQ
jgi:hypothetical protein